MVKINKKRADMGIGSLILFIAFILVAAVAASVVIFTGFGIQSKTLNTGKGTSQEVSTQLSALELYALNASVDKTVDYFFATVKSTSGSESTKFTDILLSFNTNNMSSDYVAYNSQYTGYLITLNATCNQLDWTNATNISLYVNTTIAVTRNLTTACQDSFPRAEIINITYLNYTNGSCNSFGTSKMNITIPSTNFGVSYISTTSKYFTGYIAPDEVAKICIASPRSIVEAENIIVEFVPKKGSILRIDTPMPNLMNQDRVFIYPY